MMVSAPRSSRQDDGLAPILSETSKHQEADGASSTIAIIRAIHVIGRNFISVIDEELSRIELPARTR